MNSTLETVTSTDGTPIAVERIGDGPPVILIGGAFNDRSTVAALAAILAPHLTAVTYDRRGRGASGDRPTYSVEAEVDDLRSITTWVGGRASLFGHSSGAALALEAAARGLPVTMLAVYDPAFVIEGTRPRPGADIADRLRALVAVGRREDAVALFLDECVGVPAEMIEGMRMSPMWGWFTGLAHTLPYDAALCGPGMALPTDRLATIGIPTLALTGSNSPEWLQASTRAVAAAVPGARFAAIDGQDHGVLQQPDALRSVLTEFFTKGT